MINALRMAAQSNENYAYHANLIRVMDNKVKRELSEKLIIVDQS